MRILQTTRKSAYRYSNQDLDQVLGNLFKKEAAVGCGDLIFPDAHWSSQIFHFEDEENGFELFEVGHFGKVIYFRTRSQNLLDVAFYEICFLTVKLNEIFSKVFECSDHRAVNLSTECETNENKPIL